MTVADGKLAHEQDAYSFEAWAGVCQSFSLRCIISHILSAIEQALGPLIGPLAAPLSVTQSIIQISAKVQLETFMLFNPE
jgi:hypothetical protein